MIRKLSCGKYRLYSRKVNPRTKRRRNLGTFNTRAPLRSTSVRCSISSATDNGDGTSEPETKAFREASGAAFICSQSSKATRYAKMVW
jgi:hypothetical protein